MSRGFSPAFPQWGGLITSVPFLAEEPYTPEQIDSLLALLAWLRERIPSLAFIAGHEDLDTDTVPSSDNPGVQISRKLDPGPKFPWEKVLAESRLQRLRASASA